MTYDVVIVGARCAGASLAARLGCAGLSVALLDAAALPSDQPMSTHLIQPPGMDELDALGIGDRVRALSPPLRACRFEFDGHRMVLRYREGRTARCLRRDRLDPLLQEAAVDAGADLQPQSRVVGVVRDTNGRVGGVEVRRASGRTERLVARLVVGADGRNSTVAKMVGAAEYLGYDGPRASYWAYWRRPPEWDADLFYSAFDRDDARVLFPCDDDLMLIATSPPVARVEAWRGARRAAYVADLRSFAPLAAVLGDSEPVGPVRGLVKTRYFFRAAAGPGWALAGDAGHHKEFTIGLGISDALRDARSLATAIIEDREAALERYWRRRDVERIEHYRWGQDLGRADHVTALERLVAQRMAVSPDLTARFGDVIDGRRSPYDLVPPSRVLPWVGTALLRGHVGALAPLMMAMARAGRARIEAARRRSLLNAVRDPDAEPAHRVVGVSCASCELSA